MNLYVRRATINRDYAAEAAVFAVEVAGHVSKATGLEVNVWSTLYGAPLTTVTWSARVDSQAAVGAANEILANDAAYQEQLLEGTKLFSGPIEDTMSQIVDFAGNGALGHYAGVVTAQCAGGKIADAMAWGDDVLKHVAGLTGLNMLFTRSLYGPYATLGWITLADSLTEVDAADAAMSGDPTFIEKVDQGGDLFVPGSAVQTLAQRMN